MHSPSNRMDKFKVEDFMAVESSIATIANDQKASKASTNPSESKLKNASSRSKSRDIDGPKSMPKQEKSAIGDPEQDCGCGCHNDDTAAGHPCSSEHPICLTSCSSHEVKVKVTNLNDDDDQQNLLTATPSVLEESAAKALPQQSLPNNKGAGHQCTDKRPSCDAACSSHEKLTSIGHPCSNIPCVTTCDSGNLSQGKPMTTMKGFSRIEPNEAVKELSRKNNCDCVCHNDDSCSVGHPICIMSCSSHELKGNIVNLDDDDHQNLLKAVPSKPEGEEESAATALYEQSYYDMLQFTKKLTKAEPEPQPKLAEPHNEILPREKSRDDCRCVCHSNRSKGVGHPCTDKHPSCATECSSHEELAKFGHPCSKSIKRIPCVTYCDSVELTRCRLSKEDNTEMSKRTDSTASPIHHRESLLKRMSKAFRKGKELDEKK